MQVLQNTLKELEQSGAVDELNVCFLFIYAFLLFADLFFLPLKQVDDLLKKNPQWTKDFKHELENDKYI